MGTTRNVGWAVAAAVISTIAAAGCGKSGGGAGSPGGGGLTCANSTVSVGDTTVTIEHAGAARQYIMHVPASYDSRTRVPLVLDIHGLGSNAPQQEALSGWR